MIKSYAGLKLLKTQQEFVTIKAIATQDKHDVIAPTHVIVKDGEVLGYMSLGGLPMVIGNISIENASPQTSFNALNIMENTLELQGAKGVLLPLGKDSPFHSIVTNPKMGYRLLGNVDLFVKEFNI